MTIDAAPPRFRPVAVSVWVVSACMWGPAVIVLGGLRLHQEWLHYRFLQDVQSGSYGWISYSNPLGTLLLVPLLGLVTLGVSVAWLGAAVALTARRLLGAAATILAVAAVAAGVLVHSNRHPWDPMSLEPHLLTPAFLAAAVLVLDGVAALAVARWALRTDQFRTT